MLVRARRVSDGDRVSDRVAADRAAATARRPRPRLARLNMGDGIAYALAIDLDEPLLCGGKDVR